MRKLLLLQTIQRQIPIFEGEGLISKPYIFVAKEKETSVLSEGISEENLKVLTKRN